MKVRQELFELQNLNAYITDTGKYQIRSAYVGNNGLVRSSMVILEGFSDSYNVSLDAPPSGLNYYVLTEIANRTRSLLHSLGLDVTSVASLDNESDTLCPFDPLAPGTPCRLDSPCMLHRDIEPARNTSRAVSRHNSRPSAHRCRNTA